ncbi:MAG: hypothetical protein A2905_00470 [Candidatus Levybacteria bacterium RIFCSPLOWO2_01_FULL_36_10]|nr:MAG: hypothetical protein A2905_00470 [Candidatus Levybacteria bacterium RIFCSPLOWO2_01_FULL_36_10]
MHSEIRAATAPTAARTGAITAPTTPIVRGNSIIVFPFLSLIIIFLTFPSLINALTFERSFSPSTLNVSSFIFPFIGI